MSDFFQKAASSIAHADALIIAAGAGMGVDSGLPDFRGNQGFWKAYPPFAERGLSFAEVADPRWFDADPEMAWGFYGHRMNLYRKSTPHHGFAILREWAQAKSGGYFMFTSNVDGHFQKAGFNAERIVEHHGSIHHLQCSLPCSDEIWDAGEVKIEIDESTFRALAPLPVCPTCGAAARPNILMFGDRRWLGTRSDIQQEEFANWRNSVQDKKVAVIECGAGKAIPSVRCRSEWWQSEGATLIRINPREADGPDGTISLECGALEGLRQMQKLM